MNIITNNDKSDNKNEFLRLRKVLMILDFLSTLFYSWCYDIYRGKSAGF